VEAEAAVTTPSLTKDQPASPGEEPKAP
jgi:hypothetical protein